MRFRYVLYVSRLTDPKGPGAVAPIIRTSRANNAVRALSGALLFDGELFCQYLEGDEDEVDRAFVAIEADERHDDVRVLASGFTGSRRFEQWTMAFVYAHTPDLIANIASQPTAHAADGFAQMISQCDVEV